MGILKNGKGFGVGQRPFFYSRGLLASSDIVPIVSGRSCFAAFISVLMYFELGIHLVSAKNLMPYCLVCYSNTINLFVNAYLFFPNVKGLN